MIAFGRVLRSYRERAGLSQEELAELTDLHRTYISLLERGLNSPSLRTLVGLSRALGVTLTEMVAAFEHELDALPSDPDSAVVDVDDGTAKPPVAGLAGEAVRPSSLRFHPSRSPRPPALGPAPPPDPADRPSVHPHPRSSRGSPGIRPVPGPQWGSAGIPDPPVARAGPPPGRRGRDRVGRIGEVPLAGRPVWHGELAEHHPTSVGRPDPLTGHVTSSPCPTPRRANRPSSIATTPFPHGLPETQYSQATRHRTHLDLRPPSGCHNRRWRVASRPL